MLRCLLVRHENEIVLLIYFESNEKTKKMNFLYEFHFIERKKA